MLLILGAGLVGMLIFLSLSSNNNTNNLNANTRNENRNSNVTANANVSNVNANANAPIPNPMVDDFSEQKWGTGVSQFGRIWYENGEYHMTSREKTFVVMYAPVEPRMLTALKTLR